MRTLQLPASTILWTLFDLDQEAGSLFWKRRPRESFKTNRGHAIWNGRYAGKPAGHTDACGYVLVAIDNRLFKAHRIIFAMVSGKDPGENLIDHIDRNPANNRPENLRLSTHSQNLANSRPTKNSMSGLKGVCLHKKTGKWMARIVVARKGIYLGLFATKEEASAAYEQAAIEYFGEFGVAA